MMAQRITRLTIRTVFVALVILLGLSLAAPSAVAQGLRVFTVSPNDANLRQVDPITGATVGTPVAMTLTGETINGASGIAIRPTGGAAFVLLNLASSVNNVRRLGTVNLTTGVVTSIGDTGTPDIVMVDITFDANDVLYGVSSDSLGSSQDALFTIDQTTAVPTAVPGITLTAGNVGHAIFGTGSADEVAHVTGQGATLNTDVVAEDVDPSAMTVTPVTLTGDNPGTAISGLVRFGPVHVLAVTGDTGAGTSNLILATDVPLLRFMSTLDHVAEGIAVVGTPPDCTAAGNICGAAFNGSNGPAVLYSISQATGAASMVGPIGFERVSGIAFDANGNLFGAGERMDGTNTTVLMTVDPATGAGTEIGATGFSAITDLSFRHADGVLFGQTENGDTVGTINTGTGAMTLLPNNHGRGCCGHSLAFDFDDTLFLGSGGVDNLTGELASIDQTTGIGTFVTDTPFPAPPFEAFSRANAMDFHPVTGALFAVIRDDGTTNPQNRLVTIDKALGTVTDRGATQLDLDAIAIAPVDADVAVTKTDSADPVQVSDTVTYTVTVTNNGPGIASVVEVNDVFSGAAVTQVGSSVPSVGACDDSGFPTINCDLGALAPAASATITIQVTATADGVITNDVTATTGTIDPDATNNTAQQTTGVGTADITLTKTDSADPVMGGVNFDYTILVVNNSTTTAADNVVVTDTLPAAVAYVSDTGGCNTAALPTLTCNLGTIAAMGMSTFNITVTANAPGLASNTASATLAQLDPTPADNTDPETTQINAIDLAVTKTDSPDPTAINNNITYTVTVTNNGNISATTVALTDNFTFGGGAAATFVSATPSQGTCTPAFPAVPCDLGTIAAGANATVTIVITPTVGGTITNTASATATEPDGVPANNTNIAQTTTVAAMEDFALSSTPASSTILQGQTATTTITVTPLPAVTSVALSCAATIPLGGCSISPATVNPGATAVTATLTVTTSGFFAANRRPLEQDAPLYAVWLPAAGFGVLGLVLVNEKRRRQQGGKARLVLIGLTLLLLLALVVGCGPLGRDRQDEGTPGGTYIVTVTGTGGGQTHTVDVPVTVQP